MNATIKQEKLQSTAYLWRFKSGSQISTGKSSVWPPFTLVPGIFSFSLLLSLQNKLGIHGPNNIYCCEKTKTSIHSLHLYKGPAYVTLDKALLS